MESLLANCKDTGSGLILRGMCAGSVLYLVTD